MWMQIPEELENFTITLLNATGGARLGDNLNATLHINKNDDPIYFAGKYAKPLYLLWEKETPF